ncbi:hypothetical protein HJG53_14660 [Sphingomonas sp. ID1715]|uniref:hypothetical protein n=1 Tax=Sphingomonas sp. ID1715 TaxID=1656898 RepID=UPI0014898DDC|nr:hypothetical protein [Sphingomonas sp. ID1715]NNM78140.1 hypothetical protein [Sphingomonas sp. ID1715]
MTLKAVAALAAAIALAPAAWAQAQPTAESLLARHIDALGGQQALAALNSVEFDGELRFPGDFKLTYKEVRARENGASRTEAALQGLTLTQGFDGKSGWRINPFQGRKDAETMSADEARSIADSGSVLGPLVNAKADGSAVSYLGREDFDGTDAYRLKVVQKDGDEFVYLLEPETMLAIKMTETRRIRGAQQVTEYELGDYEKVAGVYFPMSIESWQDGQSSQRQRVTIEKAVANVPVTPAMFAQPVSPSSAK